MSRDTKVYLFGGYRSNSGPSNVTRALVENQDWGMRYNRRDNGLPKYLETIKNILCSDVVVFSGFGMNHPLMMRFAHLFGKKVVYLMQGWVEYENIINKHALSEKTILRERETLEQADLILCVSENYMSWLTKQLPDHAKKMHFLNNGVDTSNIHIAPDAVRVPYSIVSCGGDRIQKNNAAVCRAVEKISQKIPGISYTVTGRCKNPKSFSEYPHTLNAGMMPQEKLHEKLCSASVFIQNSTLETFGLAAFEALVCGCSLLVSQNSGIVSILPLEETDIIRNPDDENEIAEKAAHLFENPNSARILQAMNLENHSWKSVSMRLKEICGRLHRGEDYTSVE